MALPNYSDNNYSQENNPPLTGFELLKRPEPKKINPNLSVTPILPSAGGTVYVYKNFEEKEEERKINGEKTTVKTKVGVGPAIKYAVPDGVDPIDYQQFLQSEYTRTASPTNPKATSKSISDEKRRELYIQNRLAKIYAEEGSAEDWEYVKNMNPKDKEIELANMLYDYKRNPIKLEGLLDNNISRIDKNRLFVTKFGIDKFYSMPLAEERDKYWNASFSTKSENQSSTLEIDKLQNKVNTLKAEVDSFPKGTLSASQQKKVAALAKAETELDTVKSNLKSDEDEYKNNYQLNIPVSLINPFQLESGLGLLTEQNKEIQKFKEYNNFIYTLSKNEEARRLDFQKKEMAKRQKELKNLQNKWYKERLKELGYYNHTVQGISGIDFLGMSLIKEAQRYVDEQTEIWLQENTIIPNEVNPFKSAITSPENLKEVLNQISSTASSYIGTNWLPEQEIDYQKLYDEIKQPLEEGKNYKVEKIIEKYIGDIVGEHQPFWFSDAVGDSKMRAFFKSIAGGVEESLVQAAYSIPGMIYHAFTAITPTEQQLKVNMTYFDRVFDDLITDKVNTWSHKVAENWMEGANVYGSNGWSEFAKTGYTIGAFTGDALLMALDFAFTKGIGKLNKMIRTGLLDAGKLTKHIDDLVKAGKIASADRDVVLTHYMNKYNLISGKIFSEASLLQVSFGEAMGQAQGDLDEILNEGKKYKANIQRGIYEKVSKDPDSYYATDTEIEDAFLELINGNVQELYNQFSTYITQQLLNQKELLEKNNGYYTDPETGKTERYVIPTFEDIQEIIDTKYDINSTEFNNYVLNIAEINAKTNHTFNIQEPDYDEAYSLKARQAAASTLWQQTVFLNTVERFGGAFYKMPAFAKMAKSLRSGNVSGDIMEGVAGNLRLTSKSTKELVTLGLDIAKVPLIEIGEEEFQNFNSALHKATANFNAEAYVNSLYFGDGSVSLATNLYTGLTSLDRFGDEALVNADLKETFKTTLMSMLTSGPLNLIGGNRVHLGNKTKPNTKVTGFKSALDAAAQWLYYVNPTPAAWMTSVHDFRENRRINQEYVDQANKLFSNPENAARLRGTAGIANGSAMMIQDLEKGDKVGFENHAFQISLTEAILLARSPNSKLTQNKLQLLKNLVGLRAATPGSEEWNAAVQAFKNESTLGSTMTEEEIIQTLYTNAQAVLDLYEDVKKENDAIDAEYGQNVSFEDRSMLMFNKLAKKNLEERIEAGEAQLKELTKNIKDTPIPENKSEKVNDEEESETLLTESQILALDRRERLQKILELDIMNPHQAKVRDNLRSTLENDGMRLITDLASMDINLIRITSDYAKSLVDGNPNKARTNMARHMTKMAEKIGKTRAKEFIENVYKEDNKYKWYDDLTVIKNIVSNVEWSSFVKTLKDSKKTSKEGINIGKSQYALNIYEEWENDAMGYVELQEGLTHSPVLRNKYFTNIDGVVFAYLEHLSRTDPAIKEAIGNIRDIDSSNWTRLLDIIRNAGQDKLNDFLHSTLQSAETIKEGDWNNFLNELKTVFEQFYQFKAKAKAANTNPPEATTESVNPKPETPNNPLPENNEETKVTFQDLINNTDIESIVNARLGLIMGSKRAEVKEAWINAIKSILNKVNNIEEFKTEFDNYIQDYLQTLTNATVKVNREESLNDIKEAIVELLETPNSREVEEGIEVEKPKSESPTSITPSRNPSQNETLVIDLSLENDPNATEEQKEIARFHREYVLPVLNNGLARVHTNKKGYTDLRFIRRKIGGREYFCVIGKVNSNESEYKTLVINNNKYVVLGVVNPESDLQKHLNQCFSQDNTIINNPNSNDPITASTTKKPVDNKAEIADKHKGLLDAIKNLFGIKNNNKLDKEHVIEFWNRVEVEENEKDGRKYKSLVWKGDTSKNQKQRVLLFIKKIENTLIKDSHVPQKNWKSIIDYLKTDYNTFASNSLTLIRQNSNKINRLLKDFEEKVINVVNNETNDDTINEAISTFLENIDKYYIHLPSNLTFSRNGKKVIFRREFQEPKEGFAIDLSSDNITKSEWEFLQGLLLNETKSGIYTEGDSSPRWQVNYNALTGNNVSDEMQQAERNVIYDDIIEIGYESLMDEAKNLKFNLDRTKTESPKPSKTNEDNANTEHNGSQPSHTGVVAENGTGIDPNTGVPLTPQPANPPTPTKTNAGTQLVNTIQSKSKQVNPNRKDTLDKLDTNEALESQNSSGHGVTTIINKGKKGVISKAVSVVGTFIDRLARKALSTDAKIESNSTLSNRSSKALNDAFKKFKILHPNWTFYTEDLYVQGNLKLDNGKNFEVHGELDCIAVDEDGRVHIIDFKTTTNPNGTLSGDAAIHYGLQLELYRRLLAQEAFENNIDLSIAEIDYQLMVIKVDYFTPNESAKFTFDSESYNLQLEEKPFEINILDSEFIKVEYDVKEKISIWEEVNKLLNEYAQSLHTTIEGKPKPESKSETESKPEPESKSTEELAKTPKPQPTPKPSINDLVSDGIDEGELDEYDIMIDGLSSNNKSSTEGQAEDVIEKHNQACNIKPFIK